MSLRALVYAYILGGLTFIPLVIAAFLFITIYTSVPVTDSRSTKLPTPVSEEKDQPSDNSTAAANDPSTAPPIDASVNDAPPPRRGWLTVRRTFVEAAGDGSYVTLVRSLLDARARDARPKDTWFAVLKGKVLYLYEDEGMSECEAAVELGAHDVAIYPDGLLDGELFAKRNAIRLKPKTDAGAATGMPSLTQEMKLEGTDVEKKVEEVVGSGASAKRKSKERERVVEAEKARDAAREEALSASAPWFIFCRSVVEMEDWYLALVHASDHPTNYPTLQPLQAVFRPADMEHLVATLDAQPDVIPMRWLNALIGRLFFSYYRTQTLESYIIGRLMKKLSKVKRPAFLTDIVFTEVSVGNTAPTFSKPMLKELTKEGDAALEVHLQYKGEVRVTIEATATINLGAFKSYTVKLILAAVLRELEGNLLVKIKRPPSNRIWYAFTQTPRMVLDVEPVVSDRQITWSMILNTIEARLKEIESVVMPNMDDIAFFESSAYEHRGGIWPDAVRKENITSTIVQLRSDSNASAAPPLDGSVFSADSGPTEVQHSRSAEDFVAETAPSTSPPEAIPVVRAATEGGIQADSETPNRARRRTWFSSVASTQGFDPNQAEDSSRLEDERQRGRASELDCTVIPRSQSTPGGSEEGSGGRRTSNSSGSYLSPGTSRRTPSQHSAKSQRSTSSPSTESSSLSSERNAPTSLPPQPILPPAIPPKSPKASPTMGSPNSPSFLSTLKSRAGDKQALSNSAKEAMRKWGVNWGGLRRDGGNGNTGNHDELSDDAPFEPRQRAESHRIRTSYADVRAAVAERKERERTVHGEQSPHNGAPSEPIAIPQGFKGKVRSVSGGSPAPSFSGGISVSSSRSSLDARPEIGDGPKFVAPSVSRTTAELHIPQLAPDIPELNQREPSPSSSSSPAPAPVKTQPSQAKTMTIPGIHASHRGDVMSMGYVAPTPPPQQSSDGMMKAPAIQSVYRLWKSPTLTGQQKQGSHSPGHTQNEVSEGNKDVIPLSLSPSTQAQATPTSSRPIPPPLPPRSPASRVSQPSAMLSIGDSTSSPASEALKSIATKDRSLRTDDMPPTDTKTEEASSNANTSTTSNDIGGDSAPPAAVPSSSKPPLPPRRVQAPA